LGRARQRVPPVGIPPRAGPAAPERRRLEMLYGVELVRVADEEEVASVVADELVTAARAGGEIVLTGGESPGRAYELAAAREPDWRTAALWWGDERCVPPDDERSN